MELRHLCAVKNGWTARFDGPAGGRFIERRRGSLRDDGRIAFEHQRVIL